MQKELFPHIKHLGYGGLLPFVGLLGGLLMFADEHPWHATLVDAIRFYAALIITFVGALNWGIGLKADELSISQRQTLLTYSVIPSLLSWLLLMLSADVALIAFGLLYIGCYGIDLRFTLTAMPSEYQVMRRRLSFSVAGILLMASQLV